MRSRDRWIGVVLLAAMGGCDSIGPTLDFEPGDGAVAVQVARDSYSWNQLDAFQATVTNRGDRTVYAAIGDGFNAAAEQDRLYIAAGGDALFEREVSAGSWTAVSVGMLIEGLGTVELRPGKDYQLSGAPTTQVDGTYRVRIRYYPDASRSGTPAEAVSRSFTIR